MSDPPSGHELARWAHVCPNLFGDPLRSRYRRTHYSLVLIRSEVRDYEDKLALIWVDYASGRCDGIEMMTAVRTAQLPDVNARAPAKAASREQYWAAKSFRSAHN